MVCYFNLFFVKEFVKYIINVILEERQKMLRDFYVFQYLEVKEFFADFVLEFIKFVYEEGERVRNKFEKREFFIEERLLDFEILLF